MSHRFSCFRAHPHQMWRLGQIHCWLSGHNAHDPVLICWLLALMLRISGGGAQLDGLAVGRAPIGFSPRFFARQHCRRVREVFRRCQTLQSCEPMVVVARAIIGLTAIRGGLQFIRERGGPLFPGEMPLLGKADGEREGLRLPRFGKDGSALIAREMRQRHQIRRLGN
jgi:hypothetical protein